MHSLSLHSQPDRAHQSPSSLTGLGIWSRFFGQSSTFFGVNCKLQDNLDVGDSLTHNEASSRAVGYQGSPQAKEDAA